MLKKIFYSLLTSGCLIIPSYEFTQTRYQIFTNTSFPMPAGRFRQIDLTPTTNQIELDFVYNFS